MKAELELSLDKETGKPIIRIRHHDKSNEIEQLLLLQFIKGAQETGIKLVPIGGYLESGTSNSWENYEIKIVDV